jgi:phosphoribosylamine--glycine ligase
MFLTNFDDALAAGVVDTIRRRVADGRMPDLWIPCPDKSASRVEWDKFYLREVIEEIDPRYNPLNFMAETPEEADDAITFFEEKGTEIALKPRNLTGGKGVKVQGKHFNTHEEGREYALQILAAGDQDGIEVQEKLEGHEFTLQLFTDGKTLVKPPATYDYPYREDGDEGPGTGGMGAFSMRPCEQLPFIEEDDYDEAVALMDRLLLALEERGHGYKGVLYPTFFHTSEGLRIVEVNARGGDPELINILDLMEDDVDFGEVLKQISEGELAQDSVRYKKMASAMIYLASPDYGYQKGPHYEFNMNAQVVEELGCNIRFAASERIMGNKYRSVGSSRTVGLAALGGTPWEARDKIHAAIQDGFEQPQPLEFRRQVGEEKYIKGLSL